MSDGSPVLYRDSEYGTGDAAIVGLPSRKIRTLSAAGDEVEWRAGTAVERWRLPGGRADGALPLLTAVTIADVTLHGRGPVDSTYLLFTDDGGAALAVLARAGTNVRDLWPRSSFAALERLGVRWVEESYADAEAFAAAHPGVMSGTVARVLRPKFWTRRWGSAQ